MLEYENSLTHCFLFLFLFIFLDFLSVSHLHTVWLWLPLNWPNQKVRVNAWSTEIEKAVNMIYEKQHQQKLYRHPQAYNMTRQFCTKIKQQSSVTVVILTIITNLHTQIIYSRWNSHCLFLCHFLSLFLPNPFRFEHFHIPLGMIALNKSTSVNCGDHDIEMINIY